MFLEGQTIPYDKSLQTDLKKIIALLIQFLTKRSQSDLAKVIFSYVFPYLLIVLPGSSIGYLLKCIDK